MRATVKIDLPYLSRERNRHGNKVTYARRNGCRIRIRQKHGTQEFLDAYKAAVQKLCPKGPQQTNSTQPPFPAGTLGWLGDQYFASDEFLALDAKSQSNRKGVLNACFEEPYTDKDPKKMGLCPLAALTAQGVKRLRDLKKGKPGAANNRRKYLSSMFGWAIEQTPPLMKVNPARDVRRVKYATEGFHTWTPEEVAQFEMHYPIGSKARLALALLLYTGTRRGDMVTLGKQHVRDGWLRFVPSKTAKQRKTLSEKPWLSVLARIVATSPTGDLTFLVTEYGKPFTPAGFGGWFRERCDEAGLPQCSAHGLRKAGATLAAENGATVHELMAIFDWKTMAMAQKYIEAVNRKKLAGKGMALLERTEREPVAPVFSSTVAPKQNQ